eukprot:CAMPEP_0171091756 /NCGR_PEP_ID=MMETSP0766_2-20121228/35291_1 /TAXON_ID=439317 /ORGANISM="Gambierdiscus australes, Strain CAWD 149" /LENGTH=156 /DNA_ID=CAMNT_0011549915 /DNA_START=84 /DNA_END=552 /DNA_ORIENTATION=+
MAEGGAAAPAAAEGPAHIQLKVKDQQGSEVQFKIKKSTPLRKLMDAYCSRLGLQASQVRFMVDGERIAPDDTAEKLGLEDEDLIDVAMEQTGGLAWVAQRGNEVAMNTRGYLSGVLERGLASDSERWAVSVGELRWVACRLRPLVHVIPGKCFLLP